jgi:hypothetical protein
MPLYVNGSKSGADSTKVEYVNLGDKIASMIRENNGRIGDLSRYTAIEMEFIIDAMREIASAHVVRMSGIDWLYGIDISKVVDENIFIHEEILP